MRVFPVPTGFRLSRDPSEEAAEDRSRARPSTRSLCGCLVHAEELESLHRSAKALDLELGDERCVDTALERRVSALSEQDLAGGRRVAQPCGEVRHAPESTVVVASFESNPSERGVPNGNASPEPELVAAFAPADGKLAYALAHRNRQSRRLQLVVGEGHRV